MTYTSHNPELRNAKGSAQPGLQSAWLSQKRRRADSNRCSGRDGQNVLKEAQHVRALRRVEALA